VYGAAGVMCALQQELKASWFRFAVLCCGYPPCVAEHQHLLEELTKNGGVALPSLHIFGEDAQDGQIGASESRALTTFFSADTRQVLVHAKGHLIPTDQAAMGVIKPFLALHAHAHVM
jgi:Serine hydrolase (FSH1)